MLRKAFGGTLVSLLLVSLLPVTLAQAPPPRGPLPPPTGPGAANASFVPQPPEWFPLPPEHQEYLDKVLHFWEFKGTQIQRYQCEFQRWEYDPVFGPKDPNTCKTYSLGTVRYAAPDKGLFKIESMKQYTAPKSPADKPTYENVTAGSLEHWVCNGNSIFQFDAQKKQVIETVLPKEMQGKAIVDGPLPFLFGAKADKIRERYWIRVITPREAQGEYWLEAIPKTQRDAANFKMVHVILDEKEFLPIALVIFAVNHTPQLPARTTLKFEKREINATSIANQLNPLFREFFEVKVPSGWERVVQQFDADPPAQAARPAPPRVGVR